ncbi:MAG: HEPN domain-containing protein [bacterium]
MPLDKNSIIKYRIERSNETAIEAAEAIANKHFHLAVNRIYYSIFYIVTALAVKFDFSTSKHNQLLLWFNQNFVNMSKVEKEIGRIYKDAFNRRLKGDYDDFINYSDEEIDDYFNNMKKFIDRIKDIIASI